MPTNGNVALIFRPLKQLHSIRTNIVLIADPEGRVGTFNRRNGERTVSCRQESGVASTRKSPKGSDDPQIHVA